MISDTLQKAREYEEKYAQFITEEERPVFHVTPRVGWMNDPNGFSVYQGKYHLFFQSHPYSNEWGPMHWGHVVSEDLLHWKYLPTAIAPDMPYDKGGCFSGSALELPDGRHLLMYTGVQRHRREDGTMQDIQAQCLAAGDGINYVKIAGNPVLDGKDLPEDFSIHDFRDPKIFPYPDVGYGCVVGNRTDDESGAILLFYSEDGFSWRFDRVLDRSYNEFGKMWECPDFFPLGGQYVLIVSPQDMTPLGLEFHNGNNTMALLGSFDPQTHHFQRQQVQAIDYGLDFYAPQTTLTPDGRRVMIGWMQNWDTCAPPAGAKYFAQMSLPRELSIRAGRLIQTPVRELEQLHGHRVSYEDVKIHDEVALNGIYGRILDMTVTVKPADAEGYSWFRLKFAKGSQHYSFVAYHPDASVLQLSRAHAGFNRDFIHERECLVRNRDGEIKLRLILDRFSAEIFVNDGEQVLSTTFYTPQTADGISFECSGQALVSVEKYDIIAAK